MELKLFAIAALLVVLIGCEDMQRMLKPITQTQTPNEEIPNRGG